MGLFTPFYMKKGLDGSKRAKALERVKGVADQSQLAIIATRAPDEGLRGAAAERLDDAGALEQIVLGDESKFVRASAVQRLGALGAEAALARIALRGEGPGPGDFGITAGEAADAMKDKGLLAEIARRAPLGTVRRSAVARLDDPEALRAAASDADQTVRIAAVANPHLTDPSVLAEIAIHGREPSLMLRAVKNGRITDPEALKRVALESPNAQVRKEVVGQLKKMVDQIDDANTLAGIAGDGEGTPPAIRWTAAMRLSARDPSRAVAPLVALLKDPGARPVNGDWVNDLTRKGIAFLTEHYRSASNEGVRQTISSLPNGKYGWQQEDNCGHWDLTTHFDLPR